MKKTKVKKGREGKQKAGEDEGMVLLPTLGLCRMEEMRQIKYPKSISQDGCQAKEISLDDVTSPPFTARRLLSDTLK